MVSRIHYFWQFAIHSKQASRYGWYDDFGSSNIRKITPVHAIDLVLSSPQSSSRQTTSPPTEQGQLALTGTSIFGGATGIRTYA